MKTYPFLFNLDGEIWRICGHFLPTFKMACPLLFPVRAIFEKKFVVVGDEKMQFLDNFWPFAHFLPTFEKKSGQ